MNGVDYYNSLPTEIQVVFLAFGIIITVGYFLIFRKATEGLPAGPMGW